MRLNQIIYTSCRRGIDGGREKMQVFSYDKDLTPEKRERLLSSLTYRIPDISDNPVVSKEVVSLMPRSFAYRPIGGKTAAFSLTTYLGKNHSQDEDSYGNYLYHAIAAQGDSAAYPAEYIDTPSLASFIDYEIVDSAEYTEYLQTPELQTGRTVSAAKTAAFLREGGRFDDFRNLLRAVLAGKKEGRRVIICDSPENIVLWISAVNYALPLFIADKLSFSTYEYDPSKTDVDICGVLPYKTAYVYEEYYTNDRYYLFDFIKGGKQDFEMSCGFDAFFANSIVFSYDKLLAYYDFIRRISDFNEAVPDYYKAYDFYCALSKPISDISLEEFLSASEFCTDYGSCGAKILFAEKLLSDSDTVNTLPLTYIVSVVRAIFAPYDMLSEKLKTYARDFVIEAILVTLINKSMTDDAFSSFFSVLETITDKNSISLNDALMSDDNRQKLITVMGFLPSVWKTDFVCDMLCQYVKRHKLIYEDLDVERPIGLFALSVIRTAYKIDEGLAVVNKLIFAFSYDARLFAVIYMMSEAVIAKSERGETDTPLVNAYFCKTANEALYEKRAELFDYFMGFERYDIVYLLFEAFITSREPKNAEALFFEHYKSCFSNDGYAGEYLIPALNMYYGFTKTNCPDKIKTTDEQLFDIVCKRRLDIPIADELICGIMSRIPFRAPSKENSKLLWSLFDYEQNTRRRALADKPLYMCFGMHVDMIENHKDLVDTFITLDKMTQNEKIDLTKVSLSDASDYTEWILSKITDTACSNEEILRVFRYFVFYTENETMFTSSFAKRFLKEGKSESNYTPFCTYLEFVLTRTSDEARLAVAELIDRLSSKRQELLDDTFSEMYKGNDKLLSAYETLLEMPTGSSSIFGGFSKMFKKKKNG